MNSNAATSLPKTPQQRQQLTNKIENEIFRLQSDIKENAEDQKLVKQHETHIEVLALRRNLIKRCAELSLLRLSHLQEVFKHYCTHVFRVGKHMTFDRLQYDKVHMTMERFFLFLRDFQMTAAVIDEKSREVVDKNNIITAFKKISSNSRDLSFEEFVQAIQKLAVIYWDQKQIYNQKQEENRQRIQRIKIMNQKRRKKKLGLQSEGSDKEKSQQKGSQQVKSSEKDQPQKSKKKAAVSHSQVENNENDDLVEELMKNQDLEDPNNEVREVAEKAKKENAAVEEITYKKLEEFNSLLKLTNEEKIEFYYQMINIDSVQAYKNKLTSLNLQNYISHNKDKQTSNVLSQSKLQAMQQEEERLLKLKAKMNEKKEKIKERPLPKPSNQQALKQEQNSRRRKQMKKQREKAVKELKVQQVKKIEAKAKNQPKVEYKEGEVSWQMLQKITLEHLKLKQFNIAKMYAPDEDDRYFLEEYGGRPKIASRLQARERQSLSIVQSTKMRAEQLQKKQKEKGNQSARKPNKVNTASFSKNKI